MTKKKKFLGIEGGIGTDNDGNLNIITDLSKPTDLVSRIKRNGQRAVHVPTFEQIVDYLKNDLRPGDLIITMGAGNVWEVAKELT